MPPAFGFSVGDFISAIELCTKVARALKDVGGAASEYQNVVIELHGLQNVLTRLAALEPTESNLHHVNAIRCMALACQYPLREFLASIRKYEDAMGPIASGGIRSAARKAKWGVWVADEVKKVRAVISAKVISVNLLLATHASETLSRIEGSSSTQHRELLRTLEEQQVQMGKIIAEINDAKRDVMASHKAASNEAQASSTKLQRTLDDVSSNTTSIVHQLSGLYIGLASAQSSLISLRDLGSQIMAFLRTFPAELRHLLQEILRTNMQMYFVLLNLQNKVSASPTLLLQSNIRLEDALGVVRELPYEWFRHWEPLEGLLRANFKDAPGTDKVDAGQFCLVHARRPDVAIKQAQWTRSVQPGAEILMLMMISEMDCSRSRCPRPTCKGNPTYDEHQSSLLIWFSWHCPTLEALPDAVGENTYDPVTKSQAAEDFQLFGDRSVPPELTEPSLTAPFSPAQDVEMVDADDGAKPLEPGRPPEPNAESKSTSLFPRGQNHPTTLSDAAMDDADEEDPPILSWLDQTVPLGNAAEEVKKRRNAEETRRLQEAEDIEFFRNVHVVVPEENAAPISPVESLPFEQDIEPGALIYYRNILDRYPRIERSLATRLAEVNWNRAKRLSSLRASKMMLPQLGLSEDSDDESASGSIARFEQQGSEEEAGIFKLSESEHSSSDRRIRQPQTDELSQLSPSYLELQQRLRERFEKTEASVRDSGLETTEARYCRPAVYRTSETSDVSINKNSPHNPGETINYWTKTSVPASPVSSVNSSLRGKDVYDPEEQNMDPLGRVLRDETNEAAAISTAELETRLDSPKLPPPPVVLGSVHSFECYICGETLKFWRKRDWEKHVMNDLQPYSCTEPNCTEGHITYARRRDFVTHEASAHEPKERLYRCTASDCAHRSVTFLDPTSLMWHQLYMHSMSPDLMSGRVYQGLVIPASDKPSDSLSSAYKTIKGHRSPDSWPVKCDKGQLLEHVCLILNKYNRSSSRPCGTVKSQAEITARFNDNVVEVTGSACPICQATIAPGSRAFARHLGRHLEEIAFAVVARPYEKWEFYDDTCSSNAGEPEIRIKSGTTEGITPISRKDCELTYTCDHFDCRHRFETGQELHLHQHQAHGGLSKGQLQDSQKDWHRCLKTNSATKKRCTAVFSRQSALHCHEVTIHKRLRF